MTAAHERLYLRTLHQLPRAYYLAGWELSPCASSALRCPAAWWLIATCCRPTRLA